MNEPAEIRLARIEEKLDGMSSRLQERCNGNIGRIISLEKSVVRFGERIGRLEAEKEQRKGSKTTMMTLLAGSGVLGGLIVKFIEWFGRSSS